MALPSKICIVSHSAADDGAERVLIEAVEVLCEAGFKCLVVFPEHGPLVEAIARRGAECKILRYKWWIGAKGHRRVRARLRSARSYLWSASRLAIYLARKPCDLVLTNTIAAPVGGLAATLSRIPHVWWIHEFGEEDHGLAFDLGIRLSTWFMDHTSAMVLVNSTAVASKYAKYIKKEKLHLLYYSVHMNLNDAQQRTEERAFLAPVTAKPKICIVGRVSESKGQLDAIQAVGMLKSDGIDVELLVVGSAGAYAEQLSELSRRLGIEDRIQFLGHVANPLPILLSCDVAVVCSRCEAFGRVTVEAMKLGKPVVGARTGGTAELIQDGLNGFLYTPGDHQELASKVRILLGDAKLRNRMGQAAQSWASEKFTRAKFRDDVVRLLSRATSGSSRKSNRDTAKETSR